MINLDDNISDELLAAYIDGNTTDEENAFVENHISDDPALAELVDIAQDAALADAFGWAGSYDYADTGDVEVVDVVRAAQVDDDVTVEVVSGDDGRNNGDVEKEMDFDESGDSFQQHDDSIQENGIVDDMPTGDDIMPDM